MTNKIYTSHANRGMGLESYIDVANMQYRIKRIAVIDKEATPVKVKRCNQQGKITEAWFDSKSTVDYKGVASGKAIAFDAKTTQIKTSFPLKNIHEHQYEYLKDYHNQQGISFLVVEFAALHEIYILPIKDLIPFWENARLGRRKSIPYQFFKEHCVKCNQGRGLSLDYLAAVGL